MIEQLFAWTIAVLAGAACIGALAVAIVAEVYAIRGTIERHRRPQPAYDPTARWWRERSAVNVPEQEQDTIRQAARRVAAGERLRRVAKEHRP
jgi:hypothetical protein